MINKRLVLGLLLPLIFLVMFSLPASAAISQIDVMTKISQSFTLLIYSSLFSCGLAIALKPRQEKQKQSEQSWSYSLGTIAPRHKSARNYGVKWMD